MARLIDADKQEPLIEELENICVNNEYVLELLAELKNQPTVDAEPMRYGRWIKSGIISGKCSECGEISVDIGKYCSNCGAKMEDQ